MEKLCARICARSASLNAITPSREAAHRLTAGVPQHKTWKDLEDLKPVG